MRSIKIFYFILILFVLRCGFNNDLYAFDQSDTLAIVNSKPVTSADFKNRFELSVYPGKGLNGNLYKEKRGFLYSMVAEKLLSNEAQKLHPDEDKNEVFLRNEAERMFLRDALYRREVMPKAKVSEKEIEHGVKISSYFYILDAFYFPDTVIAKIFYNSAHKNYRKEIYHLADSLNIRHDSLEIGYGESNRNIENAFFGHKPGFISEPVNTVDGWVIFRILELKPNKKYISAATNDRREMVRKIIKGRKEDKLGYEYLLSVMKGITVRVNYKIFRPLVYSIQKILKTHRKASFEPNYYLSRDEIGQLKSDYSKDLNLPMLKFGEKELNLEYVLDNFLTSGFAPADTTLPQITYSLHTSLRFMVQNYFLAERAKKLGLQNSQEVKYNVQMFLNAYRADKLTSQITDTVRITPEEINNFFTKHKDEVLKDVELRLQIFTFENLDEAAKVLNHLSKIQKTNNDTTGAVWLRASQLSELGGVLAEMKRGTVYGPIFVKGKYTIFRIVDKRSKISKYKISHSIQVARDMLLAQRKREVLSKYIAHLAETQKVKVFPDRLDDVNVTPIQMLTFRYIGFGGKIIAVPTLYPHENWIKYIKKPEKIIP